jgi:hypothetical protein
LPPALGDPISLGIMSASFIDEPGMLASLGEWRAYLDRGRALTEVP